MILTLALLLLTILLCSLFYLIGFTYMLIRSIKYKGLKKYFYQIAFALDQTGNVVCGPMFNDFWIKPNGHKMGSVDQTISYVLGINLSQKTLYPFGIAIAKIVDATAHLLTGEINHCINASKNSQIN